jgi:hypothetical protein
MNSTRTKIDSSNNSPSLSLSLPLTHSHLSHTRVSVPLLCGVVKDIRTSGEAIVIHFGIPHQTTVMAASDFHHSMHLTLSRRDHQWASNAEKRERERKRERKRERERERKRERKRERERERKRENAVNEMRKEVK